MSSIIGNNINSAIVSGMSGIQNAYQGMTQASVNIAQRAAQTSVELNGTSQVLTNASLNNLSNIRNTLPTGGDSLTSDLMSLQYNRNNALASAKVVDTAFDTVGTIIDTLT
ncbi:hypothetical protein [Alteromonas sp. RKMC-009]|uniref:hypothetical protein n=1 Tax=Alteromonas sp. RKMC-009 TaxID=2267264 RepID=UPI000C594841|nr:hypothetical protein [Alteromonas sp. RKMC-009]AYA66296.1 hypothetical protein DS731_21080 [Alteromonas sp. RKMC-009]MBT79780.1 hypothetical protein [Alteromonadaceae bacterium]MEC7692611.1 hypothetical protein [Pseudomonadota bacterium]